MMILDTVMDALTSLFPDLSRAAETGGPRGSRAEKGNGPDSDAKGDSSFAATLLSFIGAGEAAQVVKTSPGTGGGSPGADGEGTSDEEMGAVSMDQTEGTQSDLVEAASASTMSAPGGQDASAVPPANSASGPIDPVSPSVSGADTKPSAVSTPDALLTVNRDSSELDPEFRAKLDRVMDRMEKEFGHKVEMVEGYRTPERQNALFQQGRTEPGPVVTWTQDSLHSRGRAADLQVDGRWDNPQGYAHLQQIAAQEGLQTLGGKDPGHVEMPESGEMASGRASLPSHGSGIGTTDGPRIARTAPTARTARVARVASPARPGVPSQRRPSLEGGSAGGPHPSKASALLSESTGDSVRGVAEPPSARTGTPSHGAPTSGSSGQSSPEPTPIRGPLLSERPSDPLSRPPAEPRNAVPIRGPVDSGTSAQSISSSEGKPQESHTTESPAPAGKGGEVKNPEPVQPRSRPMVMETGTSTPSSHDGVRVAAGASDHLQGARSRREGRESPTRELSLRVSTEADGGERSVIPNSTAALNPSGSAGSAGPQVIQRPGSVDRVQEIHSLEETLKTQGAGRMHLDLDDADGAGTRLRLSLRGSNLTGSVDLADPLAVDRMRARVSQLHEALSRRGLDSQSLSVQGLKGGESVRSGKSDLASLLQDPLAGLARVAETGGGSLERRDGGQAQSRQNSNGDPGRFRNPSREDRNKEERR